LWFLLLISRALCLPIIHLSHPFKFVYFDCLIKIVFVLFYLWIFLVEEKNSAYLVCNHFFYPLILPYHLHTRTYRTPGYNALSPKTQIQITLVQYIII